MLVSHPNARIHSYQLLPTSASLFMRRLGLILVLSAFAVCLQAQKPRDIQQAILSIAPTAQDAVVSITESSSGSFECVVGTGFLVDREGHFVTAAHILATNNKLEAVIPSKSGTTQSPTSFSKTKIDVDHDLALCQIDGFKVEALPPGTNPSIPGGLFASLRLASQLPTVGTFAVVSGFPQDVLNS